MLPIRNKRIAIYRYVCRIAFRVTRTLLLVASTNFLISEIAISPSDLLPIVGSSFTSMPILRKSISSTGVLKSVADKVVSLSSTFLLTI